MYLSKLTLDPRSRQVQAELANPYEMHRTLSGAFSADNLPGERLLYRLEAGRGPAAPGILLQSRSAPDWARLETARYLLHPAQVKAYQPRVSAGQALAFRLVANPTRRLRSSEAGEPGKRVYIYRDEERAAWLARKAAQNGFTVLEAQVTDLAEQLAFKWQNAARLKITHRGARFDGVLRVDEPERFLLALQNGIGSAKGFGFGLLSVAPLVG